MNYYSDFNEFTGFCDNTCKLTPDVVRMAITHCIKIGKISIIQLKFT
jgi:hypothetical protein